MGTACDHSGALSIRISGEDFDGTTDFDLRHCKRCDMVGVRKPGFVIWARLRGSAWWCASCAESGFASGFEPRCARCNQPPDEAPPPPPLEEQKCRVCGFAATLHEHPRLATHRFEPLPSSCIEIDEDEYRARCNAYAGLCFGCGAWTASGCEPDARGYRCEGCGLPLVRGCAEALLQGRLKVVVQ